MRDFAFPVLEPGGALAAGVSPADHAARIVAEAQLEARRIIAEAEGIGFEQGHAAGHEKARASLAPAAAALAEAVAGLEAARAELETLLERRAVELGLAIAEKTLAASLDVQPELVLSAIGGALRAAAARDGLTIDVNPADYELVRGAMGEAIEVVPERRVARGGCIVRTTEGEIDARIGEQLGRAEAVLREAFAQRSAAAFAQQSDAAAAGSDG